MYFGVYGKIAKWRIIMNFFKRIIIPITMLSIVLTMAACSSSSNTSSSSKDEITIIARTGSHSDVINAVISDFEKDNNCNVNVVSMERDDLYTSVIDDSSNESATYDVIMIDDPLMPEYIEKNILLNMTQLGYLDDEDFIEKSRLLGKDPYPLGATYALPFSGNVQLIFYNPDMINDPSSLNTWEGILSECKKIKAEGQNGYGILGTAGNPIVSDFLPVLWAFGGNLFDENNHVILDSKESREALDFYCSLYQTGTSYEKDSLVEAMKSGEVAVALGWPSWFISGDGPISSIKQIPGQKDASSEVLATGEIGNWLLGISSNSHNPELALKLTEYLTSTDVQKKALSFGGIPTRKSVFRDKEALEKYPYFDEIYSGTNNSRVRPRTTKWSRIEEVFGAELEKCIKGEQSVDETITVSQKAISALANE